MDGTLEDKLKKNQKTRPIETQNYTDESLLWQGQKHLKIPEFSSKLNEISALNDIK